MIQKTATSTANTAYGKKLDQPISYDYKWTAYESEDELVSAKDELTLEEQVKTRNAERQANARQKQLQATLDSLGIVKPTEENDDQTRLKNMFKTLMTAKLPNGEPKYTAERAREVATEVTGVEWAE